MVSILFPVGGHCPPSYGPALETFYILFEFFFANNVTS